jgi:uncharacterized glyoxalase superfamily metalloenzyme YdcJ
LIDKESSFRPRLRQRRTSHKHKMAVSTSDEQFYDSLDNMAAQSRSNSEYVNNVNQLNETFSERINVVNSSKVNNRIPCNDDNDVEEEINSNKKRVLLVQKSREDSNKNNNKKNVHHSTASITDSNLKDEVQKKRLGKKFC